MSTTFKTAQQRCAGQVWTPRIGFSSCGSAGKIEHEGKLYCRLHHPPTVEAKRKVRNAKFDAEWDAERARIAQQRRIQAAEREVIAAAEAWYIRRDLIAESRLELAVEALRSARGGEVSNG